MAKARRPAERSNFPRLCSFKKAAIKSLSCTKRCHQAFSFVTAAEAGSCLFGQRDSFGKASVG